VAAERIRGRPVAVREAVIAALEEWIELAGNPKYQIVEPHLEWLRAVAEAAEPDEGWTREFRTAQAEKDAVKRRAALETLAESADVTKLPAQALTRLAWQLEVVGARAKGLQLLRRARQQYPADFWVNHWLGRLFLDSRPPDLAEAVRYFTAAVALRPDSPGTHYNLGNALRDKGQLDEAIARYRQAIELDPKLAVAHHNLGVALKTKGQLDEAIASYRQAVILDPKLAPAHNNLGVALWCKGQLDEAIACCRQAIALEPKLALAHNNLGNALREKGQLDEAIACYRQAIGLDPKLALAHDNLGLVLMRKGQLDEAIACHRQAIASDPKYALAHNNLGVALGDKGRQDEAITCYRQAIALDPKLPSAHFNLGLMLGDKGRLDEAVTCYRNAIALGPKDTKVHICLGLALKDRGRYAQARDAFAGALELLPENSPVGSIVSRHVQTCERLLKLEARLPRLLHRDDKPASAQEGLDLATMCRSRQRHAAAVRFTAEAFAAEPKLAADLNAEYRYNAARSATLAAAGQGEDATLDRERTRLRRQALDWLRADLAAWTRLHDSGQPAGRAGARQTLRRWQQDPDLASLRDPDALAKLPAEERAACTQFWADVAALLKKAEPPPTREARP
jgi:superkiller protein 3